MKLISIKNLSWRTVIAASLFALVACGGGGSSGSNESLPSSSSTTAQTSSILSSSSISTSSQGSLTSSSSSSESIALPIKSWGEVSYLDPVPNSYYGVKNPQLAAGPEGVLTLAWMENGIWVKQYSPVNGWEASPTRLEISNNIGGVSSGPLVAADSLGNVFVAWRIESGEISVTRYTPATGWSSVFVFEGNYNAFDFSLAVNKKGDAVLAWSAWGTGNHIMAARYTPDNGWSSQVQLATPVINTSYVRTKINELGSIVVGWNDIPNNYTLNVATYTTETNWSNAQQLDSDPFGGAGGQMWPELVVDSENRIWLFWRKMGDIWSSKLQPTSGLSTPLIVVDIALPNEIQSVDASAGINGDIRLVWGQYFHANLEQISTKSYSPSGGWGKSTVLMTVGINRAPKVTIDGTGNTQIIWALQDGGIPQLGSFYFNSSVTKISNYQTVIFFVSAGLSTFNTVVDSGGNRWATGVVDEGGRTKVWVNQYR